MKINPDFKNLIPALSADELQQLENNILADGIRDPAPGQAVPPDRAVGR